MPGIKSLHTSPRLLVHALALVLAACDSDDDDDLLDPPPPLTIVSVTPAANATRVGIDQPIQIVFSGALDASSVTTASVSVLRNNTPLTGTLAVQGSTLTFTPSVSLAEFRTQYDVNVTTAVRSAAGAALMAPLTSTFTTVLFDSTYYYQIANAAMGPGKVLGTIAGLTQCFFDNFNGSNGQQWYMTEIGTSTAFQFRNRLQGANVALDAATVGQPCTITAVPVTGSTSAQTWNVTLEGTGYRLTSPSLSGSSLGIVLTNNEQRPGMIATSPIAAQSWSFARIARR
jgi:hypothetical protein